MNVLRETPTTPKPNVPTSRSSGFKKPFLQKRKKKNVRNVLRETHPLAQAQTYQCSTSNSQRSGVQKSAFLQKERRKNVSNVLKETHPLTQETYHFQC